MSDLVGKKLDVYEILSMLGAGGMGEVYEARHTLIGRRCAIKVLHSVLEANEELLARMIREAQAASSIGHPNIVEVYDFRQAPTGSHYMVMELLEGKSLEDILDENGLLDVQPALVILTHVLSALKAAHAKKIVHRDLKPDNVFITKTKRGGYEPKILDFGISKFTNPADENLRLTKTGAVMGSPYYMSPEQASGKADIDGRADLWACGVMLFEMLTAEVPFEGNNYNEVIANILLKKPPRLAELRQNIPAPIQQIIDRALAKNRQERYADAAEMMADVMTAVESESVEVGGLRIDPQQPDPEPKALDESWNGEAIADAGGDTRDDEEADEEDTKDKAAFADSAGESEHNLSNRTQLYGEKTGTAEKRVQKRADRTRAAEAGENQAKDVPNEKIERTAETLPEKPPAAYSPKGTITSGENISQSIAVLDPGGGSGRGIRIVGGVIGVAALVVFGVWIGLWLNSGDEETAVAVDSAQKAGRTTGGKKHAEGNPGAPTRQRPGAQRKGPGVKTPDRFDGGVETKATQQDGTVPRSQPSQEKGAENTILVTLKRVPDHARLWLGGKRIKSPFRIKKDHKQHCIEARAAGFRRYMKCFFANRDRTITFYMKRKRTRGRTSRKGPRSIYDSPYGGGE